MLANINLGHYSYIINLSVAHVADLVADRVKTGNLSLVFGTLRTHGISAPFANHLLVAKAKDVNETKSALAEGALILRTAFLCIGIEECRQTK